jgi:hypothetical protein
VRPDDCPFLYSWETGSPAAPKWRLRGRTPPFCSSIYRESWYQAPVQQLIARWY